MMGPQLDLLPSYKCTLTLLTLSVHTPTPPPLFTGLYFMPADTSSPLQVADKLLQAPSECQPPLPLLASESMVPLRDHVVAKHFVLVQDATCMDDGR